MAKIRVFLIENNPDVIKRFKDILEGSSEIELIGIANNRSMALRKLRHTDANVVLMNISIIRKEGMNIIPELLKLNQNHKVLIIIEHKNEEEVGEVIKLGALGYLLVDIKPMDLIKAIKDVEVGALPLDVSVASLILKDMEVLEPEIYKDFETKINRLTRQERKILILVAQGKSNREIAEQLFIELNTVKTHLKNILLKLGAKNRLEATYIACKGGLV